MATLTAEKRNVEKDKIVTFKIDKIWDSEDFRVLFETANLLHGFIDSRSRGYISGTYGEIKFGRFEPYAMRVLSIQFSSPGWIEVLITAPFAIAFVSLIKYYIPNRKTKAEIKRIEAETRALEIENAKKSGATRTEADLLEKRINQLFFSLNYLADTLGEGNITDIQVRNQGEGDDPNKIKYS